MSLSGSREQSWRFEVWNRSTGYTGRDLTAVTGGSLSWQKNQAIKGQGSLEVSQSADGDLLNVLIRPVLTIEGWGEQPFGLWVPSFPKRAFTSSSWTGTVGLVSLEALLTYTSAASVLNASTTNITVSVPVGAVVTDWISATLTAAGFTQFVVQSSAQTESAPQSWTEGESVLRVVNDLLERIGYASLYSDMTGTLRADPYVLPADRSEAFKSLRPFVSGNSVMLSSFAFTDEAPNVPNRVRAVGKPVGWLAGQTAVAVNNDPDSPYSVANRGYVIEKVYTDVNALSQAAVQSYANQQLLNLSKDGRKAEVSFLHVPGLTINQVVYFNVPRAGDPMFATVDQLTVNVSPGGVSSATLTAITAVQDDTAT